MTTTDQPSIPQQDDRVVDLRSRTELLADNSVVTSAGDAQTYLIKGGQRQLVTNLSALFAAGIDPRTMQHLTVTQDSLEQLPMGDLASLTGTRQVDTGDQFLGAGHYMRTWGTIASTGQIAMQTRTRTVTWFGGFHGAVKLIAADASDGPTYQSESHRYGVDGTWIGTSDRTDAWWENMGSDAAGRTTQIAIFQIWDPNSFQTILDQWVAAAKKLGELISVVGDAAKVFKTIF